MKTECQLKPKVPPSDRRFLISTFSVPHTGTYQARINGHGIRMSERSNRSTDDAIIKLMKRFRESGTEGMLVR